MPMTKNEKEVMVDEIASTLESKSIVYLTNYSGLTVAQANELRNRFRDLGVEYKVYKNTLVRLAMERLGGFDDMISHLQGPTAVAFAEEPSAPARVIKKFAQDRNLSLPELKAAYIDGAFYGADALDVLASLKSKEELIGDVLGLLMAPVANIVGAVQAPANALASQIKEIAARAEKAEA